MIEPDDKTSTHENIMSENDSVAEEENDGNEVRIPETNIPCQQNCTCDDSVHCDETSMGPRITCKVFSSYKIFQHFVKYTPSEEGKVVCDASGILSKECYTAWLESRRKLPKKPMEAFRRALTAHCRGVDGRRPFPEEVEVSLLAELRKKKRWTCFEDCDESAGLIGVQGFPSRGFHEAQQLRKTKNDGEFPGTSSKRRSHSQSDDEEETAHKKQHTSASSSLNTSEQNSGYDWNTLSLLAQMNYLNAMSNIARPPVFGSCMFPGLLPTNVGNTFASTNAIAQNPLSQVIPNSVGNVWPPFGTFGQQQQH